MNVKTALDKRAVRRSFSAASKTYDGLAGLQRRVGENLNAKIKTGNLEEACLLDIGCGTGVLTGKMMQLPVCKRLIALDIALPMLNLTRNKYAFINNIGYICADAESIPLAQNSMDAVVSNLALQWCQNLELVFTDIARVLKSDGRLWFSTFGSLTLRELKSSWAKVDDFTHVNHFYNENELRQFLEAAGYQDVQLQTVQYISNYRDASELMRELKGLGACNVNNGRPRTFTSKKCMQNMMLAYEEFRRDDFLPATFEVIYAAAINLKTSVDRY